MSSPTNASAVRPRAEGHAPVASTTWRRLLGRFHFTGAMWYRGHAWAVRHFSPPVLWLAVVLFGTCFWFLLGGVRRAIGSNLEVVLGRGRFGWLSSWRRSWQVMYQHSWCLTESYEGLIGVRRVEQVEVEGAEFWQRVLESGAGFVLATAHVGHWEVGSHLGRSPSSGLGDRTIHVVREPEMDPDAQAYLTTLLGQSQGAGYEVHFAASEDTALGARLLLALRRGGVVALQSDRPRGQGRYVETETFGHPFRVPVGPLALARAAGVAVVPVFVFRTGRLSSRVVIRPPLYPGLAASRDQAFTENARRLGAEIEWAIREAPTQWFCFRELWPASARTPK